MRRGLEIAGSSLTVEQVKRLVQQSAHPTTVLRAISSNARGVPEKAALERLMPILMEVWNNTPRPDLGGRTPTEMLGAQRAAPPPAASASRAGRNDPCPCGSGRKYKKCCLREAPN